MRAFLLAAALALVTVLPGTAGEPVSPPLAVEDVASGRTPGGRLWVVVRLGETFPPRGLYSWYVAVAAGTPGGEFRYVTREHAGRRSRSLTGPDGAVRGGAEEQTLADGRLLLILPVPVRPGDPLVVLTGQRVSADDAVTRWSRGAGGRSLRVSRLVADPGARFSQAEPSPEPTVTPPPATVPAPAPAPLPPPQDDGVSPATVLMGALLGLAVLSVFRRRRLRARLAALTVVVIGAGVGAAVGASTIGTSAGVAVGLLAALIQVGFGSPRRLAR